ncbi:hypothetical protein G6M26_21045 [Agrobacterium tumefaciens]|nr:hypothetical protein [Agrobacterium tumefaciens]NTE21026.1 hypothetical protein [Agrobacterium tumefaciens]
MVARVRWDTSFDRREQGTEMQDRISRWSNMLMPDNLVRVFDRFCPETQTWKIESLVLDLGKIDYHNLESELSEQLHVQLQAKLTDLILNINNSHLQLNIIENQLSQLEVLRHFLLNGLMPWNNQPQDQSINDLLASQIKLDLGGLTELIRENGKNNLEVRKRIAWQTEDRHLIQLVKGLEPAHHEQVIEFSEEMIKIKAKENQITGSSLDFRKNLWLWIFNYLLADRGSLFNKTAFLKNNIVQMANHYHMSYSDFLTVIKNSVREVSLRHFVKHELLQIIDQLVVEKEKADPKVSVQKEAVHDQWVLFSQYLQLGHNEWSTYQKAEFNDLVINLSKQTPLRFATILSASGKQQKLAISLVSVLNDTALKAIFKTVMPGKADELLRHINFLTQLQPQIGTKFTAQQIWQTGLAYVFSPAENVSGQLSFFNFYISAINKVKGINRERLARQLFRSEIPSTLKNVAHLSSYIGFSQVLSDENRNLSSPSSIHSLIRKLLLELKAYPGNREKLAVLSAGLLKNIRQNPKNVLYTFVSFSQKENLEKVFPQLIDRKSAALLLQNTTPENLAVLSVFKKAWLQFTKARIAPDFASWLSENLIWEGLAAIVFQPRLSQANLVAFVLKKIKDNLPAVYTTAFEQYTIALAKEKHVAFIHADVIFQKNKKQLAIKQLHLAIDAGESKKAVIYLLVNAIKNKEYSLDDLQKHGRWDNIINHLLTGGMLLYQRLVKKYTDLLRGILSKNQCGSVDKNVTALFWKCLMAYEKHEGHQQSFKKIYEEAIMVHFKLKIKIFAPGYSINEHKISERQVKLKNGSRLNHSQLFILLEECLVKKMMQINRHGLMFNFADLIFEAWELDAKKLKSVMVSLPVNKSTISFWRSNVPFDRFCFLMLDSSINNATTEIRSLITWFNLTVYLLAGDVQEDLLDDFWTILLQSIKKDCLTLTGLKKIVQNTLFKISATKLLNAAAVVLAIKKSGIEIPAKLALALAYHLPNYTSSEQQDQKALLPQKLLKTIDAALIYELAKQLICRRQLPIWLKESSSKVFSSLLNELLLDHPLQFFLVLKRENTTEAQYIWLNENISFKTLIQTIGQLNMAQRISLSVLEDFYFAVSKKRNQAFTVQEIQLILFKKLIHAWLNGSWKTLTADYILQELIWEISIDRKISPEQCIESFSKIKLQLPPAIQITLTQLETQPKLQPKTEIIKRKNPEFMINPPEEIFKGSIPVKNAGLVLINHYIPLLFERLNLTDDNKVFGPEKQVAAVHYLQFLATGQLETDEPDLALNKLLCGIPLREPIKNQTVISPADIEMMTQLLQAAIGYWTAIGSSSIDGFRGNWLIRDGLLSEQDDRWELFIEKRIYDILINQSPFSFSVIKYPWMTKPLYVQWPY